MSENTKLTSKDQITLEVKKQIQKEYESMTDFRGGWGERLALRYNISPEDLLEILEL